MSLHSNLAFRYIQCDQLSNLKKNVNFTINIFILKLLRYFTKADTLVIIDSFLHSLLCRHRGKKMHVLFLIHILLLMAFGSCCVAVWQTLRRRLLRQASLATGPRESVWRPGFVCNVLGILMHCAALCGAMVLCKGLAQCTVRAESLCTCLFWNCFRS